jgi:glyoxylase-like metal-dependent hydrolase (beta-lactamase superfamily II)
MPDHAISSAGLLTALLLAGGEVQAAAAAQSTAAAKATETATDAVRTLPVAGNIYLLTVAGTNIAVDVGPDGVLVVNTGPPGTADAVLAAIKRLTDKPIRFIVDTSADPERTGNNGRLADAGVALSATLAGLGGARGTEANAAAIISHENVVPHLLTAGYPGEALPLETYNRPIKSFYFNGEAVQIFAEPAAHSDGDSVVFFRRDDVVVTGDIFDFTRFPVIDIANGGTIQGEIDALDQLLQLVVPVTPLAWREGGTTVVPGRGRLCQQAELVAYRDMVVNIRDRVEDLITQGKTLEQIKAAKPAAGFAPVYGTRGGPAATDQFVETVYKSLTAAKAATADKTHP